MDPKTEGPTLDLEAIRERCERFKDWTLSDEEFEQLTFQLLQSIPLDRGTPSTRQKLWELFNRGKEQPLLLSDIARLRGALRNARSYIPRGPSVDDADLLADINALLGDTP